MYNHEIHIARYQIFYDTWKILVKQKEDYIMKFALKGFEINGKNIEGVNLDFKLDEVDVEMSVEEMVQNGKDVMNIVTTFREMINDQESRNDQAKRMANEINELREKNRLLRDDIEGLDRDVEKLDKENTELNEKLGELDLENTRLKMDLKSMNS